MTSPCLVRSGGESSENSGNVAVFTYLRSVQQNQISLKAKKIRVLKVSVPAKPN